MTKYVWFVNRLIDEMSIRTRRLLLYKRLKRTLTLSFNSKKFLPISIQTIPNLISETMKKLFSQNSLLVGLAVLTSTILTVTYVSAAEWKNADLTWFESYPTTSEECNDNNGCEWEGQFAFIDEKKSESWVKAHNIVAIHSKFSDKYKLKTLRIKQGDNQIDAQVLDECKDSDCGGCCTKNMKKSGFLIDMEKYTLKKFKGKGEGVVQWKCIDC